VFQLFSAALGAGANLIGGFQQAEQLRRATEERMRQARMQREQAIGQAKAQAGASGVEMTSGTVLNHLQALGQEWDTRLSAIQTAGAYAETNTLVSAFAGGAGALMKGISNYSQELDAMGTATPNQTWLDATTPAFKEWDWNAPDLRPAVTFGRP